MSNNNFIFKSLNLNLTIYEINTSLEHRAINLYYLVTLHIARQP